jgi:two-component system, OmpR family, sensor histidine kinase CreC
MNRLPRLRTVLLALNVAVFLLPFGTLAILRTYDHQLIRQTEAELLVQGAFVAESYQHALAQALGRQEAPADDLMPSIGLAATFPKDLASEAPLPTAGDAVSPEKAPSPEDDAAAKVGTELSPVIQRAAAQTLAGIRLIDSRGVVVATSRSELGESLAGRQEVADALAGKATTLLRHRREKVRDAPVTSASRNTGVRVFVGIPVSVAGRVLGAVVLSRTPMTFGKAFYQDRYYLLVTAIALFVAVLLVSLLAASWVVRPVRALASLALAVADGRSSEATLERPVTYEVAALADAVTRMGTALRQRAEAIRAFAANVSHEFKTPLTSLRGSIELLQEQLPAMDAAQRARFLEILAADTTRLERLVDRLLELARADVVRPGEGRADVGRVLEALAARERAAGRELATQCPQPLGVRMDAEILDAVLGNLVQNAQQHGGAGVHVSIAATTDAGRVRIVVRDDGPGISAGNRARIFEPFFTTARDRGGTGLGLTIAQTLVQAHQGRIDLLEPAPAKRGASFAVDLPPAPPS